MLFFRQFGFEFYLADLIDAPPAVMAYLFKNNQIYRIPVARNEQIAYENLPDKISQFFMGKYCFAFLSFLFFISCGTVNTREAAH